MKTYYVYIMANGRRTVLYTGVTNDIARRGWEHKTKQHKGFTAKYNCDRLVYCAPFESIAYAIEWEKKIKAGSRRKKIELIEENNPAWDDLYEQLHESL